jgi:hypothetical protein
MPVYPGLHKHAVFATVFLRVTALLGHAEQSCIPELALNESAAHATQDLLLSPAYPALQEHASAAVLAVGDEECKGHAMHGNINGPIMM